MNLYTSPIPYRIIAGSIFFCFFCIPDIACSRTEHDALIFTGDFESGDLSGWNRETCCDHSVNVVQEPVRAGKYAVRVEVRRDDPDVSSSKRSEIKQPREPQVKCERWYGFSIYLPEDYIQDHLPEIVTQWHGSPDMDDGEVWRSPPLALITQNGNWRINWRWDADKIMKSNRSDGNEYQDIGPYEKGKWTDWVFHVKWSWEDDGLIEVWKDGEKVMDYHGPSAYNDDHGVYFKTGVYKWVWKRSSENNPSTTDVRVIYLDEYRFGNEHANYDMVAPR
ncbi:MAG: polysaccharide lyase [bacterium]|jgi:hypothetical protein